MSQSPVSRFISVMGHEIHLRDWGDPEAPAVVCWHGMSRAGRDFDGLAQAFSDRFRVITPDTIGRGLSTWATEPEQEYRYPYYVELIGALLAALDLSTLDWVGTSMGGILGMMLAGGPLRGQIRHLVLNDIGPERDTRGHQRIGGYIGHPPVFATVHEAVAYMVKQYEPFGLTAAEWWETMEWSLRRTDAGALTLHYDPRIAVHFQSGLPELDLWTAYDAIQAPTLVIRGAVSDVLSADVAQAMTERGPQAELWVVPDTGHAPSLNRREAADVIRAFLTR